MDKTYTFTANSSLSLKKLEKCIAPTHGLAVTENEQYQAELLDTFDGELTKSGKLLLEEEGKLLLIDTISGTLISQTGNAAGRCLHEIELGPVQSQMSSLSKLRALIPISSLTVTTQTGCMLDDEQKTVARILVCTFKYKKKSATLLISRSLRGYAEEFTILQRAIQRLAGKDHGSLLAVFKLGAGGYDPKPDIALDPAAPIYQSTNLIIATFIQVARQNEAGIIADIDTEFLHDYRVSLRKVRSVISLFKGVYSADETIRLKKEFADLMQITGRLRDLDVYLLDRSYYYSLVPSSTHAGLDIMFDAFADERRQLHKSIKKSLKAKAYKKQIESLTAACTGSRWQKGELWQEPSLHFGCTAILKRYTKVCRIARTIKATTPDETVHELRIHCKKLRYLMEFFTPLFDRKKIKTLIKSLKILQDNLGRFNDFSVQQVSLTDFLHSFSSEDEKSIKVAESIGGLIAMLNHLQKKEKDQVMANFTLFDSEETRTLFHDLFSTGK